jgi:hypothetical protein
MPKGNHRRDRIVGEGETVVKVAVEKSEQAGDQAHDKK